jgi:hypothetical protein
MAQEKVSTEQTAQPSEHEFIVRPPLSDADLGHLDRLIQRTAARRPTSEFSGITEDNLFWVRYAAELYGLDRLEWALVELCFRPGPILTIDSLQDELDEIVTKERSARHPRDLEKEDMIVMWACDLFRAGVVDNLDDFFIYHKSWDSAALRIRIRGTLLV